MADTPRFAAYLKEARTRAGLTQAGLAEQCGLTGSYVSLLESGRKPSPSDPVVHRIAAVLGLDPAKALEVAHLDRAPEDLRRTLERLRRQARRERDLRERATEALVPFSLWNLLPPHLPGRVRANAGNLDAPLVDALDRLAALASAAPDLETLRESSRKFLDELPPAERRRVLAAVPDLAAARPEAGGPLLVPAPPPGLPPRILPGDLLVVDPALVPAEGDLVLAGDGSAVLPFAPGGPAPRGVVVEVRRRLR